MQQKDILNLIERTKTENLTDLTLNNLSLDDLPKQLFELQKLKTLRLKSRRLKEIPDDILKLNQLEVLKIEGGNTTTITDKIVQLKNLRELMIYECPIRYLPRDIEYHQKLENIAFIGTSLKRIPKRLSKLTSLKYINFASNSISGLPDFLADFANLEVLWLYGNRLNSIPDFVFSISQLRKLSLAKNPITTIPNKFDKLENLNTLFLSNLSLSEMPNSIFSLNKLEELHLGDNDLKYISEEIKSNNQLKYLVLAKNKLKTLPHSIKHLENLQTLDVSQNQIEYIPKEIGELKSLCNLDISENNLAYLPIEIENLKSLGKASDRTYYSSGLRIKGNHFNIPEEILNKDSLEIIRYILDLQESYEKKTILEAKLIFIGSGSVGKTSLANLLIDGQIGSPEMTIGIQIRDWLVQRGKDNVKLHVWDFGGQEIMHATHKFFITRRSAYVLVIDPRVEDKYGSSELEYWLKLIRSYVGNVPVVVVINKCETHKIELPREELKNKYENIIDFVETSCVNNTGIDILKQKIIEAVHKLNHLDTQFPLSYYEIKLYLEQQNRDYITYQEYFGICKSIQPDFKEESMITLIGILHDLGIMLNFRDEHLSNLSETQVLNPEWVTKGVYQIITSQKIIENKGIVKFSELGSILDIKKYSTPKEKCYIMEMMERFELCFRLEGNSDSYFIPGAFPKDRPKFHLEEDKLLKFEFHYDVMPSSIMSRFIVRVHSLIREKEYWRNGVVLAREKCFALVKSDPEERRISLEIGGDGNRRDLLSFLRGQFDIIHNNLADIKISKKAFITLGNKSAYVDYDDLLYFESKNYKTMPVRELNAAVNVSDVLNGFESDLNRYISFTLKDLKDEFLERIQNTAPELISELSKDKVDIEIKSITKILFLAANPIDTPPLKLDEEIREIGEGLQRSKNRERFNFVNKMATRPKDLSRALLEENPNIVHFSGHGTPHSSANPSEIVLEDENGYAKPISGVVLGELFKLFKEKIKCVILNSCYSEVQAKEIVKYIPIVIGMKNSIDDKSAITFATTFYDALGAGRDIKFAFEIAKVSMNFEQLDAGDIPIMLESKN